MDQLGLQTFREAKRTGAADAIRHEIRKIRHRDNAPWGELRMSSTAEDGSIVPLTVASMRERITLWVSPDEAQDQIRGPQLDEALSPGWDALST